jgi:hypothetical protein
VPELRWRVDVDVRKNGFGELATIILQLTLATVGPLLSHKSQLVDFKLNTGFNHSRSKNQNH